MNYFKTAMLLAGMTGFFLVVGFLLGGQTGMMIALVIAIAMNAYSYWNSDKAVLRMHNARPVDQHNAPEFYEIVSRLAVAADLPEPAIYIIDEDQPNAFATGRNPENAAVAATTGLLRRLSYEEVAAVMAHELAHIKNRDTLIMTVTATIAGAISMLANFAMFFGGNRDNNNPIGFIGTIAIMILAPIGAMLVQTAISRTREYAADRLGAEICGHPEWLASALANISNQVHLYENMSAERNPASAHMFIINPLSGKRMDNLFSTHPNAENRINALMQMQAEYDAAGSMHQHQGTRTSVPSHSPNKGPWS